MHFSPFISRSCFVLLPLFVGCFAFFRLCSLPFEVYLHFKQQQLKPGPEPYAPVPSGDPNNTKAFPSQSQAKLSQALGRFQSLTRSKHRVDRRAEKPSRSSEKPSRSSPVTSSGGASSPALVRHAISGYRSIAMCQQRQQRRPVCLRAGHGSATPPAPFLLCF